MPEPLEGVQQISAHELQALQQKNPGGVLVVDLRNHPIQEPTIAGSISLPGVDRHRLDLVCPFSFSAI